MWFVMGSKLSRWHRHTVLITVKLKLEAYYEMIGLDLVPSQTNVTWIRNQWLSTRKRNISSIQIYKTQCQPYRHLLARKCYHDLIKICMILNFKVNSGRQGVVLSVQLVNYTLWRYCRGPKRRNYTCIRKQTAL